MKDKRKEILFKEMRDASHYVRHNLCLKSSDTECPKCDAWGFCPKGKDFERLYADELKEIRK
jgi:hypothetical protein